MTDFVFEQINTPYTDSEKLRVIKNYAQFLKQPLTLGMFVPCDDEGNVLEDPGLHTEFLSSDEEEVYEHELYLFEKSEEKVLFKGFRVSDKTNCVNGNLKILRFEGSNQVWAETKDSTTEFRFPNLRVKTVEDLDDLLLELTESAIKQIGL